MATSPSRELDTKVAIDFFKIDISTIKRRTGETLPFYSSQYDDAWLIIQEIRTVPYKQQQYFFAKLRERLKEKFPDRISRLDEYELLMVITPVDICVAALRSVGQSEKVVRGWSDKY